jgi:hypothetical protein
MPSAGTRLQSVCSAYPHRTKARSLLDPKHTRVADSDLDVLWLVLHVAKRQGRTPADFRFLYNGKFENRARSILLIVHRVLHRRYSSRSRRLATQLARIQPTQSGGGHRLSALGSLFQGCSLWHSQAHGHGMEARMGLPRRCIYLMAASMCILDTYNRAG